MQLQHGSRSEMPFSLEDLITAKESAVNGNEAKRAKKSETASSSSRSGRIQCHVGNHPQYIYVIMELFGSLFSNCQCKI